jgi:hypothetical protein
MAEDDAVAELRDALAEVRDAAETLLSGSPDEMREDMTERQEADMNVALTMALNTLYFVVLKVGLLSPFRLFQPPPSVCLFSFCDWEES